MGVSETSWIAGLLVVALFVSAVGTLSVVNKVSITGFNAVDGSANATVGSTVSITLPTAAVDFGAKNQNDTDDTTDESPAPFVIQNDGNVNVNITASATALWSGTTKADSDYKIKCGDTGELACPAGSNTTFLNLTGVGQNFISSMTYDADVDTLQAEIGIHVPSDEPAGPKTSTVTFTASQA